MKGLILKKNSIKLVFYMILIFFICRFFNFELFRKNPFLQQIYANISKLIFLLIITLYLKGKFYKKDIKLLGIFFIYFLLMLIITISNNGSIRVFFMVFYPIIGTFLLISMGVHRNKEIFIKAFAYLFYILVVINFFDAILFKDLSSEYSTIYYFFAGKNQIAIPLTVGFSFIKIYYERNKNKKRKFLLLTYLVTIVLTALITKSGTCIISILLLLILNYCSFLKKIIKPFNFFIGYSLFLFSIIVLQVQNYFKFLIVDVLHKDITFTHRTIVWEKALDEIKKALLFGHGLHQDTNYFQLQFSYGLRKLSAHNQVLQHLYEVGLITTLILIFIYFFCCFKKSKIKSYIYFFNTIIVILITWFAEAPGTYALITILIFCYYSEELE